MTGIDAQGKIICSKPLPASCETAFAYGDKELDDFLNAARWGWQITVNKGQTLTKDIYAGAGQNDLAKGTKVGSLTVKYEGTKVTVTYTMNAGFTMSSTHLYVGEGNVTTTAPGQYGQLHEGLTAAVDTYQVAVSGTAASLNVVAHAVTCAK